MSRRFAFLAALALTAGAAAPLAAQSNDTTDVVVLGVAHSAMLVAETYQPAVLRAWFDRVDPDAICVERAPEEFARGSHYEFTYEIQHIVLPYAREHGIPVCPFDWLPSADDQILAFGIDLEQPPFLRGPRTWSNFLAYGDPSDLRRDLFASESEEVRAGFRDWYASMADRPRHDFARRLFLYRTFMQAMRVARAARQHPGGRVLVVVGSMHKEDIERILADQPGVRIVAPPAFGAPTAAQVERHLRDDDLAAIATFNLLGAQAATGNVDFRWLARVLDRWGRTAPGPELALLRTRLEVLEGRIAAPAAADLYRRIRGDPAAAVPFTWDGVLDRRRLDSFFDPFGNLTVAQRALLEEARERQRAGEAAAAERLIEELEAELPAMKAAQLRGYWSEYGRGHATE